MPRQARIDTPGALHHVIVRGIERRTIFNDDTDRNAFLERLGDILSDTKTSCFAWALVHYSGDTILFSTGEENSIVSPEYPE